MQVYKWSDSDVILYTVGIVAMLDVYYAAAVLRNKLGVVANCCCVWNSTPLKIRELTLHKNFRICLHFNALLFIHVT